LTITTIGGLLPGAHTLEIDTTGKLGVVSWCGIDTRTAGAKAEGVKLGNGGMTGKDMRSYITSTGAAWADIDSDLVIVILGTNDYVYADSTVSEFKDALGELVSTVSAAVDNPGFIFTAPALSPTTPVTPLSDYRDAMYERALALNVEFFNGYDMIAPYAVDPAVGVNDRHLNETGGDVLCRLIFNHNHVV
jgi:lysophospholipase L1-like esterase